nr:hypothetical protein [Leptospira borgpetersenii]
MAASLSLEKYTNELRPSAILIEGPYDFNPKSRSQNYLSKKLKAMIELAR